MAPPEVKEVLPSRGALFHEEIPQFVLCKPKILPLKSMTLEKVENMQREAEEKAKEALRSSSAATAPRAALESRTDASISSDV